MWVNAKWNSPVVIRTHKSSPERKNGIKLCRKLTAERTAKDTMTVTTEGTHGTHLILAELGPAQGLVAAGARAELGRHVALEDKQRSFDRLAIAGIDDLL